MVPETGTKRSIEIPRDLYALEVSRILATAHYGDACRVNRACCLYTSACVNVGEGTVGGSGGGVYRPTLTSCTCADFRNRGITCKHMMAICIARKITKLMACQWYATKDGTTWGVATLYNGLVLFQDAADPEPKRVSIDRIVQHGHCDTIAQSQEGTS